VRALVVDDQEEIFRSIRSILHAAGFRSEYAGSITEARSRVQERCYDLAFVDLQMPPGHWGGLEVIREFGAVDAGLPVIVLSGAGTLAESIEAMRRGALDYIQKEHFETDFESRVLPRYRAPYAIDLYPSVISYLYRSYEEEENHYLKARKLIDVFEILFRLIALLLISEDPEVSQSGVVQTLVSNGLERPSLGIIVSFVYRRIKSQSEAPILLALRRSEIGDLRRISDEIVTSRNENFGHSVAISASHARALVQYLHPVLVRVINATSFLRRVNLFVASSLTFDGTKFSANGNVLRGRDLAHPPTSIVTARPLTAKHVIALIDDVVGSDVHPLINIERESETGRWCYQLYDKIVSGRLEYSRVPSRANSA